MSELRTDASVLVQPGFREATDAELLSHAIEGSIDDADFFARKAIGWALLEHSTAVTRGVSHSYARPASLSMSRNASPEWGTRSPGSYVTARRRPEYGKGPWRS